MLLRFLGVLLVLIAIDAGIILAPAFSPVPRESTKSAAQSATHYEQNPQDNNRPCPAFSKGNGMVQTGSHYEAAQQPGTTNGQGQVGSVSVTSLPEVAVASDYKGWVKKFYDWGPWAFGGVVAVFSGFQIWLLNLTLKRVSRQADLMNRQNVFSRESLRIADESAKAARISADAARDSVRAQEASTAQWLEFEKWRSSAVYDSDYPEKVFLRIEVDVVNKSQFPLTLKDGFIKFVGPLGKGPVPNWRTLFAPAGTFLAPNVSYTVTVDAQATNEGLTEWRKNGLTFEVTGKFTHIGALKRFVPQEFQGMLLCVENRDLFDYLIHPNPQEGESKHHEHQPRNPN